MEDWKLIVATLFIRGSCNKLLSASARRKVWIEADGYGRMTAEQLDELQLFEDWSHIRDCSDEGQKRVADAIRFELADLSRLQAERFTELGLTEDHYADTVAKVVAKLGTTTEEPVPCNECGSLDRYGATCDCD